MPQCSESGRATRTALFVDFCGMSDQSKPDGRRRSQTHKSWLWCPQLQTGWKPKPMLISEVNELKQDAGPELLLDEIEQQR